MYMNQEKWKSEAQYQAACNKSFCRNYPEQAGRLILIYNNPPNGIMGAMLVTMGLRRGASDFFYFRSSKLITFIELKIGKGVQSADQISFQNMVESLGWEYYLLKSTYKDDLDGFDNLINKLNQNV